MNRIKMRLLAVSLGAALALCSCADSISSRPDSSGTEQSSQVLGTSQVSTSETGTTTQPSSVQTVDTSPTETQMQTSETTASPTVTSESADQPDETIPDGIPMWEGTAPGGSKMIFIGSIHAAKSDFYPLSQKIQNAYAQADTVAAECDTESAMSEDMQFQMQRLMYYSDGTQIKDVLSEEAYGILCRQMTEVGGSAEQLANYKPWAAYETINSYLLLSGEIRSENALDNYLMKQAHTDGKPLFELEDRQVQIDIIAKQPDKLYDALFRLSKNQTVQSFQAENSQLYNAWLKGDLQTLSELSLLPSNDLLKAEGMSDEDISLLRAKEKAMIYDRNIGMANGIKQLFNSGNKTLVIVGLAHYLGDQGIIAMLEKEGYTFKRI